MQGLPLPGGVDAAPPPASSDESESSEDESDGGRPVSVSSREVYSDDELRNCDSLSVSDCDSFASAVSAQDDAADVADADATMASAADADASTMANAAPDRSAMHAAMARLGLPVCQSAPSMAHAAFVAFQAERAESVRAAASSVPRVGDDWVFGPLGFVNSVVMRAF